MNLFIHIETIAMNAMRNEDTSRRPSQWQALELRRQEDWVSLPSTVVPPFQAARSWWPVNVRGASTPERQLPAPALTKLLI